MAGGCNQVTSNPVPDIESVPRSRSYYGRRAKIGVILPSMNNTFDPELARVCPPGVSWHTTRILLRGAATPESFR